MKVLLKILILAGVVAVSILSDDYIARGMSVAVCVATVILGYIIGDCTERRESYGVFLFSIGYGLGLIFFLLSLLVEVHIDDNQDNVKIRSRFGTHTIAEGSKLEVKHINYAYSTEYGFTQDIESDDFLFVYTNRGTCVICSKYARMMEIGVPFSLIEKDYGDGKLQFIADTDGHIFDFHGGRVDEKYHPIKVDHSIPDPYAIKKVFTPIKKI